MIRLYRAPCSTNVERVALALAHKGLAAESVWIDSADRSRVQRVSGQPLVPVVEFDDGAVVFDSMQIVRVLEERHPHPPLYPFDAAGRARTIHFVDWFNGAWKAAPNAIAAEIGADAPDLARIDALALDMAAALDRFEAMLDGHEYLLGDAFSAADCAAYPSEVRGVARSGRRRAVSPGVGRLPAARRRAPAAGGVDRAGGRAAAGVTVA